MAGQIANAYSGLPIADLIGSPLKAACDSQMMLAKATSDFIQTIGFDADGNTRQADFTYKRHTVIGKDPLGNDITREDQVNIEVPMIAVVPIPTLQINNVDVTFDMEVKTSEQSKSSFDAGMKLEGEAKVGWGPFSAKVNISGSVSTHKENTRSSDQSAKYHVNVHAEQSGTPEGLSRVIDAIVQTATAPKGIENQETKGALTDGSDYNKAAAAIKDAQYKIQMCETKLNMAKADLDKANHDLQANKDDSAVDGLQKAVNEKNDVLVAAQGDLKDAQKALYISQQALQLYRQSNGAKGYDDIVSDLNALPNKAAA